ncbi:hypothetical protein F5144DRAFT_566556 [Chaetomium tenue]|uniref:Uncharacterized protein n=1 Tax=Chaetomium tenue TaxID=1854479 RepID=A0ACB7PCY7_9PEZI|nr:hypothetical protein F5144DRAFT_566556 [Chaetomium globosum]
MLFANCFANPRLSNIHSATRNKIKNVKARLWHGKPPVFSKLSPCNGILCAHSRDGICLRTSVFHQSCPNPLWGHPYAVRDLLHSPQGLNSRCIDPIEPCTHKAHPLLHDCPTWNSSCQLDRPGRPSMQQLKHQRQTRSRNKKVPTRKLAEQRIRTSRAPNPGTFTYKPPGVGFFPSIPRPDSTEPSKLSPRERETKKRKKKKKARQEKKSKEEKRLKSGLEPPSPAPGPPPARPASQPHRYPRAGGSIPYVKVTHHVSDLPPSQQHPAGRPPVHP